MPHEDATHTDIIEAVRMLEHKAAEAAAELKTEIRIHSESIQRLAGSVDANWEQTREQGKEIVRLNTLHEANSRERFGQMEGHFTESSEAAITIHPKALRLAALVMTVIMMFVGIVGALIGVPIVG